jgi:4-amino-4-deoxy-L-arabinose transferase-like glycosyltransferase
VNIQKYLALWTEIPRTSLLIVTVPLLFLNGHHQSLLAYDEGYYAVQARFIWETRDWVTPQLWGLPIYDRTIGLQWLIALAYHLLGLSEYSARLPSMVACIVSVLLTYEIGKILFTRQIAWFGASILMLMALWLNESHMAQQNTALVSIELLGIWSLLKVTDFRVITLPSSLQSIKVNWGWGVVTGAAIGMGFLIKGFMIFVPVIALLPYIISHQRYRKLLANPGVYLGLVLGVIPTGLWLIFSYYKYGIMPLQALTAKLLFLSKTDSFNPSPFYYFWNLPANIFPWALFSLLGAITVWHKLLPGINYSVVSLTLGYPITLFILLSLFRTRMPYYTMQLLPFMALLASTAFIQFMQVSHHRSISWYRLVTWLSYAFSGLGVVLVITSILLTTNERIWDISIPAGIRTYALPATILGCGWSSIGILWRRWQPRRVPYWLASWLLPAWLTILSIGLQGAWVNKNSDFMKAFHQLEIEQVITSQPINLLTDTIESSSFKGIKNQDNFLSDEEHETLILLSFYTPHLGRQMNDLTELSNKSYAWTRSIAPPLTARIRVVGRVQGWELIQKMSVL